MTGEGILYSVALHLTPATAAAPARPPDPKAVTSGYHAYSLVLRLLAQADPDLARQLHDDSPRKPLTVSALLVPPPSPAADRPTATPIVHSIRITLLQERVFAALARAVLHADSAELTIGTARYRLNGLATAPGTGPLVRTSSFAQLRAEAAAGERDPRLRLRLLSPAVFRSAGERQVLFPTPAVVFSGLLEKWNAFCPPAERMGLDRGQLEAGVQVADYRLETRRVAFGSYWETGALGWVDYQLGKGLAASERQTLRALARFAYYAGVGAKTTMGLGQAALGADASWALPVR